MAKQKRSFHESWYRIAKQSISLKANVNVHRQLYRGTRWYVLSDPWTNQFFRLRPAAYALVSRLTQERTVEAVWQEVVREMPDEAPGQEEVIQLLAQLYHANLLHYEIPTDSAQLFDRYKKRKQKILKANLASIMFFRVPLYDPDELLKRIMPFIRVLLSPIAALVWIVVMLAAVKVGIENASELSEQSQGILAPSNLFLLYCGLVIIKTLHEFGHSFAVRRFGGEVHTMGVMFLIFTPVPYMDATAAWAFRNKWQRAFVGAAGMIIELFVAALALFVWAATGPGVVHSLAYNMLFIASVSTLLFNLNPLLRFDGYYILSDWLDIPNLHTQSRKQLRYLVEHHLFKVEDATPATTKQKEATILTVFGIASGIYRFFIFTVILLFVADQFLLAGMIMAVICIISWVIRPIVKLVKYLASSPRLERVRPRAVSVCLGLLFTVFTLLYVCPFPNHFEASGVLKAKNYAQVVNGSAGYLTEIVVPSGSQVVAGQVLARLYSNELSLQLQQAEARYKEVLAIRQQAMLNGHVDLKPVEQLRASAYKRVQDLKRLQEQLTIRADLAGTWIAPQIEDHLDRWLPRGSALGELVNPEQFYFASVIPQQDASRLFAGPIHASEIKLYGQAKSPIAVQRFTRIPMEQTRLPSKALGWGGGGDIAIDTQDPAGLTTAEPFYELHAILEQPNTATLFHGHTGRIRFELAMEPLLRQWWRLLRQLLQDRYQI